MITAETRQNKAEDCIKIIKQLYLKAIINEARAIINDLRKPIEGFEVVSYSLAQELTPPLPASSHASSEHYLFPATAALCHGGCS